MLRIISFFVFLPIVMLLSLMVFQTGFMLHFLVGLGLMVLVGIIFNLESIIWYLVMAGVLYYHLLVTFP